MHVLGSHVPGDLVEVGGQLEVPAHRRVEHVGAPLVVGDGQRLVVGVGPRHVDLQVAGSARPATGVERVEDVAERVGLLVDRDQPVGPRPGDLGRGRRHRCTDQRRRFGGQRVEAGAVDGDQPVVADLLAGEQGAHHRDALGETLVADVLGGPTVAGDVLVGGLAGSEGHPEPAREHLGERRRGLGDDRRVVALAGRVDDAERQLGRRHRRAEPRPREARLALALTPRREVVRRHRGVEPRLLGELHTTQQLARWDLFVRGVPADDGHLTRVATPAHPQTAPPRVPAPGRLH